MLIDYVPYILVIAFGFALAWTLLRSGWPGWKGLPFFWLVLLATIDLGVAPLLFDLSDVQYRVGKLTMRAHGFEALRSSGLILIGYLMIAVGLISVRLLPHRTVASDSLTPNFISHSPIAKRAWRVSLLFFVLGATVNAILIGSLLRNHDLFAIASERALFTDESLESMPAFTLRVLRSLMLVGSLGMVVFSAGRAWRLRTGIAAGLSTVVVAAVYGGRGGVITDMLCLLLAYRYAVGPIPVRRMACYVLLLTSILTALVCARFSFLFRDGLANVDGARLLRYSLLPYCRVDNTAWVLNTVPDAMPFTGLQNAAGVVARFVPGLQIPGTGTLWRHIVDHFYGGVNPSGGVGGVSFGTAAELYSWGGWLSVAIFAYIIGLFFGVIFEWERRSRHNPFLLLIVVMSSTKIFLAGLQGALPNAIWETGVHVVLAATMATLSIPTRRVVPFLLLLWWNAMPFLVWKAFDLDPLRVLILGSVPLSYFWAVQSLRITGAYFRTGAWHGGQYATNPETPWCDPVKTRSLCCVRGALIGERTS